MRVATWKSSVGTTESCTPRPGSLGVASVMLIPCGWRGRTSARRQLCVEGSAPHDAVESSATYPYAEVVLTESRPRASVDLQELTLRLLGQAPATEHPAGAPIGPTEIVPGLYAANLCGAATVPTGYAVISLCRVDDLFTTHPVRRELYVIDQEADHNAALGAVVRDAVDSIDAFHAERLPVVVHCHGGASRTGLVLRAWLMRMNGWDESTATQFLEDRWPTLGLWNESFTEFLRTAWAR